MDDKTKIKELAEENAKLIHYALIYNISYFYIFFI